MVGDDEAAQMKMKSQTLKALAANLVVPGMAHFVIKGNSHCSRCRHFVPDEKTRTRMLKNTDYEYPIGKGVCALYLKIKGRWRDPPAIKSDQIGCKYHEFVPPRFHVKGSED